MDDERVEDAIRAVRMYYFQDMTMDVIARHLHTSRSTVSRLITFAKATGLIEFRLRTAHEQAPKIERRISDDFGVTAHVVPVPDTASELEALDQVARAAARTVDALYGSDMTLGVAWGTTVGVVSKHLVPRPTRNCQIVQLNGAGNTRTTGIEYASDIVGRFGSAFGAGVQQFPVPTFFDYPETKQALWRERSIRRILDLQERCDVVVFSIGAVHGGIPSHVYAGGYLEEGDFASLEAERVVGDVATVFLREDGSHSGIALNERSSGPDPAVLRSVPRRLCVASGKHRVRGLRGALAAGLVSDLVVDEVTATALLALPDETAPSLPSSPTRPVCTLVQQA